MALFPFLQRGELAGYIYRCRAWPLRIRTYAVYTIKYAKKEFVPHIYIYDKKIKPATFVAFVSARGRGSWDPEKNVGIALFAIRPIQKRRF